MKNGAQCQLSFGANQMARIERFRQMSGCKTRTGAIRRLIERGLEAETLFPEEPERVGVLSIVYDCRMEETLREMAEIQLGTSGLILFKTRVCVETNHCLKVLGLKGTQQRIQALLERFRTVAGVRQAWFSECRTRVSGAKAMHRTISKARAENGWVSGQWGMVMTVPLVLAHGGKGLWRRSATLRSENGDITLSSSVHLDRDTFLQVLVLRKPAAGEFPLLTLPLREEGRMLSGAA
jgi:metal-responsive CopG/Arc/MetJ family transcriptional regulator